MAGLSEQERAEGLVHGTDELSHPATDERSRDRADPVAHGGEPTVDALAAPALAAAGMGVYQLDLHSQRFQLDAQSREILHQPADASLQTVSNRVHPSDLPHLRRVARAAITGDRADY
ncbi:hypothetical protein PU560_02290, partial [Georgenia sp. 10Sc9-8]|nr:hypothetical protein [Georgenia halotolerans]